MAYWPCTNRSCNSVGQAHPNCRCPAPMADGGMVDFCSGDRAHNNDCEYFADGGVVEYPDDEVEILPIPGAPSDSVEVDEPVAPAETVEYPDDEVEIIGPLGKKEEYPDDEVEIVELPPEAKGMASLPIGSSIPILGPLAEKAGAAFGAGLATLTHGGEFGENYDKFSQANEYKKEKFAEEHPIAALGSELAGSSMAFTPASKAAAALSEYAQLGKTGSAVFNGAFSNFLLGGSDLVSKMIRDEEPENAVAATVLSTGLGGLAGGLGAKAASSATKKLTELNETKLGDRLTSWLAGIGAASNPNNAKMGNLAKEMAEIPGFSSKDFTAGQKAFQKALGGIRQSVSPLGLAGTPMAAAAYGYHQDGLEGALTYGVTSILTDFGVKNAGKIAAPVVMKILSSGNTLGVLDALSHTEKVAKGIGALDKAIEGAISGTAKTGGFVAQKLQNKSGRDALERWIETGHVSNDLDQMMDGQNAIPGYAEGGEVQMQPVEQAKPDAVATHFPAQNMTMNAVKSRAAQYLSNLRPQDNAPKLAFDRNPDTKEQKREYQKALDIAANPLGIIEKVQNGSLQASDVKHLNAMMPEVAGLMQQRITEKITNAQMKGKRPSYKVRQGLSMLLGTPLSSEMTPTNIQAAQQVFASGKQQPQGGGGGGGGTSKAKLSKSDQAFLTDDQARTKRQQRTT